MFDEQPQLHYFFSAMFAFMRNMYTYYIAMQPTGIDDRYMHYGGPNGFAFLLHHLLHDDKLLVPLSDAALPQLISSEFADPGKTSYIFYRGDRSNGHSQLFGPSLPGS